MDRTTSERVAVIEEVVLRMEAKLDQHVERTEKRVSRLERLAAWVSGALAVTAIWVRMHLHFGPE